MAAYSASRIHGTRKKDLRFAWSYVILCICEPARSAVNESKIVPHRECGHILKPCWNIQCFLLSVRSSLYRCVRTDACTHSRDACICPEFHQIFGRYRPIFKSSTWENGPSPRELYRAWHQHLHVISYHTLPHRATPCHTITYHSILYRTVPYHTMLRYASLHYKTTQDKTIPYTQFAIQDSGLFGPNPWKFLAQIV